MQYEHWIEWFGEKYCEPLNMPHANDVKCKRTWRNYFWGGYGEIIMEEKIRLDRSDRESNTSSVWSFSLNRQPQKPMINRSKSGKTGEPNWLNWLTSSVILLKKKLVKILSFLLKKEGKKKRNSVRIKHSFFFRTLILLICLFAIYS